MKEKKPSFAGGRLQQKGTNKTPWGEFESFGTMTDKALSWVASCQT